MSTATNPVKATRTAFEVLEALVERRGGTATELAADLEYTPGTVHNHLATLHELGYATKRDGRYRVGLRFLYPACAARSTTELWAAARGVVPGLADATGERVEVVALEESRGVVLHAEGDAGESVPVVRPGQTLPMGSGAHGKVLLAHREGGVDGDLGGELTRIRDEGIAFDSGESHPDVRAVAAPVVVEGTLRGSLGVSGPADRLRGKTFQQNVPGLLLDATERVARELLAAGG